MKWPLVSREAYEAACSERDWLRSQTGRLLEQLTRIGRREVGLPEVPRGARVEIGEIPAELARYIAGFESRSIRGAMRSEAFRRRQQGTSWEEIVSDAMKREGASE